MSAATFFLYCLYALIGTVVLAFCVMMLVALAIEVRKRWKASK